VEHRNDIQRIALDRHERWIDQTYPFVFAQDRWLLDRPVDLSTLSVELADFHDPPARTEAALGLLRHHWPLDASGHRIGTCHEAIGEFDRPALWFDAKSYRLTSVDFTGPTPRIQVAPTTYWQAFDFSEGLKHEAGSQFRRSKGKQVDGPLRKRLGTPFDVTLRHCGIGLTALTVRREGGNATFFLHRRSASVATSRNETSVIPAGEFQPSDDSTYALTRDCDIWYAVMREYAEELLGADEVRVGRGAPIDYDEEWPFSEFQRARLDGLITTYLIGIGMHPVSWKCQLYLICVFDGQTFDRLFADMVPENDEGLLELPSSTRPANSPFLGWKLDEETVSRYVRDESLSPAGKVLLTAAWRHRSLLLDRSASPDHTPQGSGTETS
jgi:hypothetical protein